MSIERCMNAAQVYIGRGWKIFVVTREKRPFHNCDQCQPGRCAGGGECFCGKFCHAFYAATDNLDHIRAMLWKAGEGAYLALRTGTASGVFALDAEGDDKDGYGATGTEVLDEWHEWAPEAPLPPTLAARTSGGGTHLLYRQHDTMPGRNRILPNIDLKADGGYVVLPPGGTRRWVNWASGTLEEPGPALLTYLRGVLASRSSGSGSGSGILALRSAAVIPAGSRYEFTRDIVYHLRRQGTSWDEARRICYEYWQRYEQPPSGQRREDGVWFLPFSQVEYELTRAWARVQPQTPLSFAKKTWMEGIKT